MSPAQLAYYDENIPCLAACPVNTNAGMYVAAIADGDDERAYLTARLPNPFASVCGRVCAAPCEDACRRGEIDEPIAIRALKRFVTEQFGTETSNGTANSRVWEKVAAPPTIERDQSIGIVGGGPAGMACAHDLRRLGYQVTVYEATDKLGGAMWLGIPEYRLDREVLGRDLDAIVNLGVKVHLETKLGIDVTLNALRTLHDAVFLGIGAGLGRGLDIEGVEADGVYKAIEFLVSMNRGYEVEVGERVVVVGGGDVAMDAARTALRAADYDFKRSSEADQDPAARAERSNDDRSSEARTIARSVAREILVMSLESRDEMPAHDFEVEEAEEEGIKFAPRRGPARVLVENGQVVGIETVGVTRVFDEEGRFSPTFDESDRQSFDADTIILAIGQAIDLDALGSAGPEIGPRRSIQVDDPTGRTSLADVWAGGDGAKGPRTLIDAIADGRRSAADIHRSFGGEFEEAKPGRMPRYDFHRLTDEYDRASRFAVPTLETSRRNDLAEVETGFTPEQARCEASRCLRCFANIQLDTERCVLCALCADVCPLDLISLVPSEEINPQRGGGTVFLLDESACIRCALCIERCPPDALSMGVWTGVGVP